MHTSNHARITRARSRRGSYSPLIGVLIWVVVGFGALSVDLSFMTMANLQAQATADAASHAALIGYRENKNTAEGDSAAAFVIKEDLVALTNATLDSVEYGEWDFDAKAFDNASPKINAARAKVSRTGANGNPVKTLLAGLIGVPQFDVDATAIATQQQRAVMLALDMSCSMMDGNGASTTSSVAIMRLATKEFLDYIVDRPQAGDRFGIAMFAEWAAIEPTEPLPWGTTCPYSGSCGSTPARPLDTMPPWLPLTAIDSQANIDLAYERLGGICDTDDFSPVHQCEGASNLPHPDETDIGGCTNPEAALLQAIDELTIGAQSSDFRGILFMSDGLPNCGTAQAAEDAADLAWGTYGISIWTITITSNGWFDTAFMDGMVRGIGFSQTSDNAAQLPAMFKQVAKSLPTAFVE